MTKDQAISYLLSRLDLYGVSTIRVDDGQIFAFSNKKLEELKEAAKEANKEYVIVFVKHSGTGTEFVEN